MNCLDVRRYLLSVPSNITVEVQSHLQACTDCAQFAKGLADFEQTLKKAADVPVPDGLASRILLRQRMARNRPQRWPWLAAAASLFMAIAVVTYLGVFSAQQSLESSVLAHIESELHHLEDRKNLSLDDVNALLKPQGVRIDTLARTVNYAGACQMRRQQGAHLVLDSAGGPVTVLVMPGERTTGRTTIKSPRFQGVIIPIPNGSMAIVGEDEQQWRQLENEIRRAILPVI